MYFWICFIEYLIFAIAIFLECMIKANLFISKTRDATPYTEKVDGPYYKIYSEAYEREG